MYLPSSNTKHTKSFVNSVSCETFQNFLSFFTSFPPSPPFFFSFFFSFLFHPFLVFKLALELKNSVAPLPLIFFLFFLQVSDTGGQTHESRVVFGQVICPEPINTKSTQGQSCRRTVGSWGGCSGWVEWVEGARGQVYGWGGEVVGVGWRGGR